ncbi:LysR substrate-binding domain-containing protein [Aliihoeflea sp. PC F10.4]
MPISENRAQRERRTAITVRELEVLSALIETGTATNAAARLGVSQSAVSRAIAQLEDQLQKPLFERSGGRLIPTPDGLAVHEDAAPIFAALARIGGGDKHANRHKGSLRIAAPPTIAHRFLPPFVASFAKANPRLFVGFEVVSSDVLVTGVAEARFDIALTDHATSHQGVRSEPLLETQAICVVPAHHRLAARETISPADIDGEPFVALTHRHSGRAAIDRIFARANIKPRVAIEAATSIAALQFVGEGLGVSIFNPFPIQKHLTRALVARPFLPAITYRASFLLPMSQPASGVVLDFMEMVREGTGKTQFLRSLR